MTTNWNALLGLSTYTVRLDGWPTPIRVDASSPQGEVRKAQMASHATTNDPKWLDAAATVDAD